MRVVVAQHAGDNSESIRQLLLGMGLECGADDCVGWSELSVRLARGAADLVLVRMSKEPPAALDAIRQALPLTKAPILAVGAASDPRAIMDAMNTGARRLPTCHAHMALDGRALAAPVDDEVMAFGLA